MIDLPESNTPLRVALVYNRKKEDITHQSVSEHEGGLVTMKTSGEHRATNSFQVPQPTFHHAEDLYAEWDTFETIDAVRGALAEIHDVTLVEADECAFETLRATRPDIVFNIAEGLNGVSREAQMPAMLEMLQIPYTGSDPLTLALCLDKSRTKEILTHYHIPTPQFSVVSSISEIGDVTARFPAIVKPLHEGSSKGIYNSSLVRTAEELGREIRIVLDRYKEPALVEEFLGGREFTVAMLGNGTAVSVLPIVEIKFDSLPAGVEPIYSYEAKWIWDRADAPLDIFECPANIAPELLREIQWICRRAYAVLRCRDWCRIDVRLDGHGRPHIIELNPLPGILPNPEDNSCFPKAARAAGMNYPTLIQTVLRIAAERYRLHTHMRKW